MRKVQLLLLAIVLLGNCIHAQDKDQQQALSLVRANAVRLHLSDDDVNNAVISNSYVDPKTNIRYVYLQQAKNGVKVFNGIMTIIFRDGEVLYSSGTFVQDMTTKAQSAQPRLDAAFAVSKAAQHLKLKDPSGLEMLENKPAENKVVFSAAGIAKQNIQAELFWVTNGEKSTVKLAWNINIDVLGSADWWNVRVDANSGEVIEKDNWTVNDNHGVSQPNGQSKKDFGFTPPPPPPTTTNGSYFVVPFPFESPIHHQLVTETQPWLKAGAGNAAITNGWHFDGTNNYSITRGNNVFAYLDVATPNNAPNGTTNWPDTSSTASPSLTFGTVPVFSQQPSAKTNRKAALTNLFYWNNIIHDVTYQYGFNEVSGNFQADNLSRGGSGSDYVQAEAQDNGGTNNANFSTPNDGSRPRMQMYLWTGMPAVIVNSPASIAGSYGAVESNFSTANKLANIGSVTAQVVYFNDASGGTHDACSGAPTNVLTGKIALINRSTCAFTIKVKEAQNAGAIGVIMVNNVPGDPLTMGGTDNTITIPAVMISQADGAILAGQLSGPGLNATLSPPIFRDGDYDNGVVVHEYGHGVSNRLTGGPANSSCLGNAEQGGEGWSDYLALMLTTDWANTSVSSGTVPRPVGNYATSQSVNGGGIRTFAYCTDMNVNPLTYANMIAGNTESHFIGEIWCSALWDMTWNIIQQQNSIETNLYNSSSNGGNAIALKLVLEGMRLQPCQPGFLDARDAILAADSVLYNGAHKCSIWKAFARRGMGFSAKQGLSTSATDQVAAYDVPSAIYLSKNSAPLLMTPGSQQTINISASCQCLVPSSGYTIRDTIPTGFSYVSSTGGVLNGNVVTFSSLNFVNQQETKNFSITLQATAGGCVVDTAINDNRTTTIGGLTPSSLASTVNPATQWVASTVRSKSAASSWRAANSANSEDFVLTSSPFLAGNLSVLSFWHYYYTERTFDGGTVELSTNGGTVWFDASPYIVQNGYNTTMDAAAPWTANQKAFSGTSYAQGSGQFINTIINLSPFNGQNVRVRFRMRTDVGNPGALEGWFIDDIMQLNGCGGMVKAGLYNASNAKIDSMALPIFIKSNGLPTTILSQPVATTVCPGSNASFTVSASGGTLTYQWQVSTNGGANFTDIAGATSATLSLTGVTAAMNGNLYRCVVDNGSNPATSATGQLTVNPVTSVTATANAAGCEGTTVVINSNATGGSLAYQWQVSTDGVNFNNINGATAANLTLTNTTVAQNGNKFRVVVTGTCGNATSQAGTLTINSAPSVAITPVASDMCTGDPAVTLTATPTGGVWAGQGVTGNQFSPVGLPAGLYPVTYSLTNASGCVGVATTNFVVNDCADKHLPLGHVGSVIIPTPSDGKFFIWFRTDLYTKLAMRVYQADGKLVDQRTINGITYDMKADINLRKLAAGIYFLSLYDEQTHAEKTFRILIAR